MVTVLLVNPADRELKFSSAIVADAGKAASKHRPATSFLRGESRLRNFMEPPTKAGSAPCPADKRKKDLTWRKVLIHQRVRSRVMRYRSLNRAPFDAGGVRAISRRWSEAEPPETTIHTRV